VVNSHTFRAIVLTGLERAKRNNVKGVGVKYLSVRVSFESEDSQSLNDLSSEHLKNNPILCGLFLYSEVDVRTFIQKINFSIKT